MIKAIVVSAALLLPCLAATASCATRFYEPVDKAVYEGNTESALQILEKEKKQLYGKDAVLYYLDKGMIAHFAARYGDSTGLLEDGERAIEAAFTKSITQKAASFIVNDMTQEYPGEDYEDLYINIFNALNYYHLGNQDDAMVEIRRLETKLRALAFKYNAVESELSKENSEAAAKAKVSVRFSNSALARYLSILFYRARGLYDDARIDRDLLKRAFADQKAVYPYTPPASVDEELSVPANMARLNVIAFSGLAPLKVEETTRIMMNANWIKITLPRMVRRPLSTSMVQLEMKNGKNVKLELLEDIQNVAIETFKKRQGIIEAKTIIRSLIKSGTAAGLSSAGDANNNAGFLAAGILLQIFTEVSEQADLRVCRYFPAQAHVGGLTVEPGSYSFSINYYDAKGQLLAAFPQQNVALKAGALNLIETAWFK